MSYLPQPPRAWSRVQQIPYCTDPIDTSSTLYNPLTNSTITPANANLFNQILYKANILQYKNNSSNLSKNQRFAQIAKGKWVGKKAYGTQGITYTNPNTSGLYRANAFAISPNTIPGFVNNVSGPYQTGIPNPNGCPNDDTILTQGNLICNTLANPCTNKIIKRYTVKKWHSITASNVPGFSNPNVIKELYWDNRIQTYLPRVRRTMNNSGNKWPQNYNSFVSACLPTSNLSNVLDDVANKVDQGSDISSNSNSLEGVLGSLYENVGKDIKEYTDKYSLGENLTDIFTYTVYRTLSVELFKESFPSSPNYTYIYEIIVSCLEGLYKSVIRDREYNDEIKALNRIIDDLRNISSRPLLDASATVDAVALIRPEIKVYVSRYGFPEGGVFESDKLATIIAELAVSPQTPPQQTCKNT